MLLRAPHLIPGVCLAPALSFLEWNQGALFLATWGAYHEWEPLSFVHFLSISCPIRDNIHGLIIFVNFANWNLFAKHLQNSYCLRHIYSSLISILTYVLILALCYTVSVHYKNTHHVWFMAHVFICEDVLYCRRSTLVDLHDPEGIMSEHLPSPAVKHAKRLVEEVQETVPAQKVKQETYKKMTIE